MLEFSTTRRRASSSRSSFKRATVRSRPRSCVRAARDLVLGLSERVARLEAELARRGEAVGERRLIEVMFGPFSSLLGGTGGQRCSSEQAGGRIASRAQASGETGNYWLVLPKGWTHDI